MIKIIGALTFKILVFLGSLSTPPCSSVFYLPNIPTIEEILTNQNGFTPRAQDLNRFGAIRHSKK